MSVSSKADLRANTIIKKGVIYWCQFIKNTLINPNVFNKSSKYMKFNWLNYKRKYKGAGGKGGEMTQTLHAYINKRKKIGNT
jgi:hypothetical protein